MKVDSQTMVCAPHGVLGCQPCMVDDFERARDQVRAAARRYRQQWRETPIAERFDLGGEG